MQIEIFTICDFAQNYGDRMVLSGVMNHVQIEKFPSLGPPLYVVVRASFEHGESGEKIIDITFTDPEGKVWIQKSTLKSMVEVEKGDSVSTTNFLLTITQPVFKSPGCYKIGLTAENETRTLNLFVQQSASPSK